MMFQSPQMLPQKKRATPSTRTKAMPKSAPSMKIKRPKSSLMEMGNMIKPAIKGAIKGTKNNLKNILTKKRTY